jgi:SAM-dependent methyltransferase
MTDLFRGIRHLIDFRLDARKEHEMRVASKNRILDVGGQNSLSRSRKQLNSLGHNPNSTVVCTDIHPEYKPDIVDDICNTAIKPDSFDGVYCDAILEHVQEYWKAIDNIHDIIKEDGEAFFYVPFMFHFHDLMDYHRFTFTEVARMLGKFSQVKIFVPGETDGFGWIFWYVVTMTTVGKYKRLHGILSKVTDSSLKVLLSIVYRVKKKEIKNRYNDISVQDFCYYYIYLFMNHGFCAWVKK